MDQYIFYYVLPEGGKKTYPYLADFPCSVGDQVEIPFGRGNKPVSGEVKDIFRCLECDAPVPVDKARRIIRNLSAPETPELPEDETPAPVQKPAPAAPKASPFVVLDSDPANNEVIAQAEQLIAAKDPQAIFEWAMDHLDAESDVILDEVTKALQAASELGHTQAMLTLGDMFLKKPANGGFGGIGAGDGRSVNAKHASQLRHIQKQCRADQQRKEYFTPSRSPKLRISQ